MTPGPTPDGPIDRRAFFRRGLRELVRTVADTYDAASGRGAETPLEDFPRLRPPGARDEPSFLAACTKCDDCIQACPAQCITRVPEGHRDAGTPVLVPSLRACVLCSGLQCTRVCEPGALRPLERNEQVTIGVAEVDPATCTTFHGETCTICWEVCPSEPKAIVLHDGRPRVEPSQCTGCGLCEERCPTQPSSVRVWPVVRVDPLALDDGAGHPGPPSDG